MVFVICTVLRSREICLQKSINGTKNFRKNQEDTAIDRKTELRRTLYSDLKLL